MRNTDTERHLLMGSVNDIEQKLRAVEVELAQLDAERDRLVEKLRTLRTEKAALLQAAGRSRPSEANNTPSLFDVREPSANYETRPDGLDARDQSLPSVTENSPAGEKIKLFLRLFRGRDDVYARRFESRKTGKSGYAPVCRNEWVPGTCEKARIPCQACNHRAFEPVTPRIIRNHLLGCDPDDSSHRDFTVGVYAMRLDETCWFLAVDFDKAHWQDDASAYIETCRRHNVPGALERSRSGNGAHVWIFFSEPVPATLARKMGSYLHTYDGAAAGDRHGLLRPLLPEPGHAARRRIRQPDRAAAPAKAAIGL